MIDVGLSTCPPSSRRQVCGSKCRHRARDGVDPPAPARDQRDARLDRRELRGDLAPPGLAPVERRDAAEPRRPGRRRGRPLRGRGSACVSSIAMLLPTSRTCAPCPRKASPELAHVRLRVHPDVVGAGLRLDHVERLLRHRRAALGLVAGPSLATTIPAPSRIDAVVIAVRHHVERPAELALRGVGLEVDDAVLAHPRELGPEGGCIVAAPAAPLPIASAASAGRGEQSRSVHLSPPSSNVRKRIAPPDCGALGRAYEPLKSTRASADRR